MKISFEMPARKDELWSKEAGDILIGQTTNFKATEHIVYPAEITSAEVVKGGKSLIVEMEVDTLRGTAATSD